MSVPQYGLNKHADALKASVNNTGFREITVVTAADDSHTLTASDGGSILISAALAASSVIKLPEASQENVGLKFRILYTGTMATLSYIQLPNAGAAVFAGAVEVKRCATGAGVADAVAVNNVVMVTTVAQGEKSLKLDENDESFGGSIGTDLTFEYVSPSVVLVGGHINFPTATTAIDAVQSTSFTATGY